jgi:hypothetical protein
LCFQLQRVPLHHDEDMLVSLSEQTTVEKGVHKTVDATRKVRKQIRTEEVNVTNLQNEIAKVRVDVLNTHVGLYPKA